ncbi:MAG TPA: RNA methyltransferase [Candidatus Babeliales bacterium]|jgi:tRNA (guanine37-N1)-methyltransferase|nr:RNA methyltransferase [Candidatus Babeliales bacterium]
MEKKFRLNCLDKMNISILTVFDQLYEQFVHTSLVGRAQEKGIVHIDVQSFFTYVQPKERIDAPTFGPGAGMLIRPDVVQKAIEDKEAKYGKAFKVFFSPRGEKIDQRVFETIAARVQECGHLMVIPARYEGMDARVEDEYADLIVSMGDFVIMGGDVPAMLLVEGVLRLMPQVVGKEESVCRESFNGPFVDFPSYTEPIEWKGKRVPDVLRSGNHGAIEKWRHEHAVQKTVQEHFLWLRAQNLTSDDKKSAQQFIPSHYVALMHSDVLIGEERKPGVTSVTSIDIHDIARSSKTYGVKEFFIVTPLLDQQKIVQKMLDFWKKGIGFEYNRCRYDAIQLVQLIESLNEVIKKIEEREGKKPVVIATSAQAMRAQQVISFYEQKKVWESNRPVLILFGTGQGLSPSVIEHCDYLLLPVGGFSDFNHLSVRSAVAIVLDRWLGISPQRM